MLSCERPQPHRRINGDVPVEFNASGSSSLRRTYSAHDAYRSGLTLDISPISPPIVWNPGVGHPRSSVPIESWSEPVLPYHSGQETPWHSQAASSQRHCGDDHADAVGQAVNYGSAAFPNQLIQRWQSPAYYNMSPMTTYLSSSQSPDSLRVQPSGATEQEYGYYNSGQAYRNGETWQTLEHGTWQNDVLSSNSGDLDRSHSSSLASQTYTRSRRPETDHESSLDSHAFIPSYGDGLHGEN